MRKEWEMRVREEVRDMRERVEREVKEGVSVDQDAGRCH